MMIAQQEEICSVIARRLCTVAILKHINCIEIATPLKGLAMTK